MKNSPNQTQPAIMGGGLGHTGVLGQIGPAPTPSGRQSERLTWTAPGTSGTTAQRCPVRSPNLAEFPFQKIVLLVVSSLASHPNLDAPLPRPIDSCACLLVVPGASCKQAELAILLVSSGREVEAEQVGEGGVSEVGHQHGSRGTPGLDPAPGQEGLAQRGADPTGQVRTALGPVQAGAQERTRADRSRSTSRPSSISQSAPAGVRVTPSASWTRPRSDRASVIRTPSRPARWS